MHLCSSFETCLFSILSVPRTRVKMGVSTRSIYLSKWLMLATGEDMILNIDNLL